MSTVDSVAAAATLSAAGMGTSTWTAPAICSASIPARAHGAGARSGIGCRSAWCGRTAMNEGCLHLDLPSADEAEAIRHALHIRKRRHLSPEAVAKARSTLERFRT